jgi:transposase
VNVSTVTLFQFYRKHKIRYITTNYIYQQGFRVELKNIHSFTIKLAALIKSGAPVLYFDEAAFNVWMRNRRTWTSRERPVKMVINERRLPGITVFGAISSALSKPVFMIGKSTNKEEVLSFFRLIRQTSWFTKETKLYIVLDNARAHIGTIVKTYCEEHNIELLFMPGYSPEFNTIEALWSVIKRRVKSKLAQRKFVNLVEEDFKNLVLDVLDNVTPEE